MKNVLVTCPPMLGRISEYMDYAEQRGIALTPAKVTQTLSQDELVELVPQYDGWIIGDDPASNRVFEAGVSGKLKAAIKWGVGVDNVDFAACERLAIPVENTPMMFGGEVADIATAYVIGLARQLFLIDREIRTNHAWPKPAGVSLYGKTVGVVGLGDIGRNVVCRLATCGMKVVGYDPFASEEPNVDGFQRADWPDRLVALDFLVFTCALTRDNRYMLNADTLAACKSGIYVVNVARGPLIDEAALEDALSSGQVNAAALDVFETEPLPAASGLREHPRCIFGSHNASNTIDAVDRTSQLTIDRIAHFLIS